MVGHVFLYLKKLLELTTPKTQVAGPLSSLPGEQELDVCEKLWFQIILNLQTHFNYKFPARWTELIDTDLISKVQSQMSTE